MGTHNQKKRAAKNIAKKTKKKKKDKDKVKDKEIKTTDGAEGEVNMSEDQSSSSESEIEVNTSNDDLEVNKTDQSQKTSEQAEGNKKTTLTEEIKFLKTDKAPFIVHLKFKDNINGSKRMSILDICSILYKAKLQYDGIDNYSRAIWEVYCTDRIRANNILACTKLKEVGVSAYIPKYTIFQKGVIKDIPMDISPINVMEILNKYNKEYYVVEAIRLKRRRREKRPLVVNENNKELPTWEDSRSVCITIRGKELPTYVKFWNARLSVERFVPATRQCFKCGQLGHISKYCKEDPHCLKCGGAKHADEEKCPGKEQCVNCKGEHSATDRNCPLIQKATKINQMMANENVGFITAKKMVEGIFNKVQQPEENLNYNMSNFPNLNLIRRDQNEASEQPKKIYEREHVTPFKQQNTGKNVDKPMIIRTRILESNPRRNSNQFLENRASTSGMKYSQVVARNRERINTNILRTNQTEFGSQEDSGDQSSEEEDPPDARSPATKEEIQDILTRLVLLIQEAPSALSIMKKLNKLIDQFSNRNKNGLQ
uniref:CCHC-type domain-containing protein n=1 Tax=Bracon brevicornis TaxID=1563983 RepID=A0A6V7HU13_9HYME